MWVSGLNPTPQDHASRSMSLQEVPLQYGFPPDAWNPMADCFILKKEEVLLPEKMRIICLMDASSNMNNKWYGRAFMQHNEALGTLEDEQEGSRKEHNCPECVLKKILCCDVMRQLRRAGFLCSNDAIQCYDRIVHAMAMLSMMRLGADKLVLMSLFKQLQQAEHYIMTAQGIEEQFYGGKRRTEQGLLPFQGVMQGTEWDQSFGWQLAWFSSSSCIKWAWWQSSHQQCRPPRWNSAGSSSWTRRPAVQCARQ